MDTNATLIGHLHIPAGSGERRFETASWYITVEYPEQTVPVYKTGNFCRYIIEGTEVYEFFPSSFAGNMTGGGPMGKINRPGSLHRDPYDYIVAGWIADGTNPAFTPAPGVGVTSRTLDHPVSCQGYIADYSTSSTTGTKYTPCGCDLHLDPHGAPKSTERDARGCLDRGYKSDEVKTVVHHMLAFEGVAV